MLAQAFDTRKPAGFDQFFVGFDTLFDRIVADHQKLQKFSGKYPPHNIRKIDESNYVIELATAGFTDEELEITYENGILTVKGTPKDRESNYLYQGIAYREFEKQFALNEEVKVIGANMVNGLLVITLERVIPEHKKPRTIPIKSDRQLLTE